MVYLSTDIKNMTYSLLFTIKTFAMSRVSVDLDLISNRFEQNVFKSSYNYYITEHFCS